MNILGKWLALCDRFDALVIRERLLIFLSCLVGLYLIFDTLLILPISNEAQELASGIEAVQQKLDQISVEKNVFDEVAKRDPDANVKREYLKLQGKFAELESDLGGLFLRLVPNDYLSEVIQGVSKKTESFSLKSLEVLPPKIIDLGTEATKLESMVRRAKGNVNTSSAGDYAQAEKVYENGIRIVLKANYFEVIKLLQSLEELRWKLYWSKLDYKVIQYPLAEINIELYTLSVEESIK